MHNKIKHAMQGYFVLLALSIYLYALMYAPQPMFNTLSNDFGVDRATTGLTLSVYTFALAIAPMFVGLLLEKIGKRRTIIYSTILIGLTGPLYLFVNSFYQFLVIRIIQGFLTPVLLTAIMTSISQLFIHLDLKRALAGYVTSNLIGAMVGRLCGGFLAEQIGWRITLCIFCISMPLLLFFIQSIPKEKHFHPIHKISEYILVLKQKGVKPLIYVEACGIFVFMAIGNLIPFRMAELGYGHSESLTALMYLGYSIGLIISLTISPLIKLFGNAKNLLIFASGFFMISLISLSIPSIWMLFGGLWLIACGEFVVHAMCPGIINRLATKTGLCDRAMVNGLFLSCYYIGGVLGSFIPAVSYNIGGWLWCYGSMQIVLISAFVVLLMQKEL